MKASKKGNKNPWQLTEDAYEKMTGGLVTKLSKIHSDGIKGKGVSWSNQAARYEVSRRLYRFAYTPVKRSIQKNDHSRLVVLQEFCERSLEMISTTRISRSNPFLLGITVLDDYFEEWCQKNKSQVKLKIEMVKFLEKHLQIRKQTKSNVGNLLLAIHAAKIPSKRLRDIYESEQVTTVYKYLNTKVDNRSSELPLIIDELVEEYMNISSVRERKRFIDERITFLHDRFQEVFPANGQVSFRR